MIQAVVFDLDGLMVDTEPLSRQAWEQVLADLGCTLDETAYASVIGLRLEDSAHRLKEACRVPISAPAFGRRKSQVMAQIVSRGVPTMLGLEELLAAIEQRGLPWAVATSSTLDHARTVLAQIDLLARCRALAAGDEVQEGKPAPDVYLLAAQRLDVAPGACLALEDSLTGATAAVAAGMHTLLVPAGPVAPADSPTGEAIYASLIEVRLDLPRLLEQA